MFASQLLRILQTVPSDVKHKTSVYDSAEQGMTMKDNQNGTLGHDFRSFGMEADPLAFQSKEVYRLDECWNAKFVDDLSTDNQNGNNFIAEDNLVAEDHSFFTDKIVMECGMPESIVCYKEVNYHVVRDICVDEGMYMNNKISFDSGKDDDNSHSKATDKEVLLSHGIVENTKNVGVNEHGGKEENDDTLLVQELPSDSSVDKDFNPERSMQKVETNLGASKPESFVDKALPIQEFGTRSFLRSFLNSLDTEETSVIQPSDQVSSGKVVSSPEETEATEDVQPSHLSYNSKVEIESIMFNFNSPAPLVGEDTNDSKTENVVEPSLESRDVLNHNDATDADNLQLHSGISTENAHNKEENNADIRSNSPHQFDHSKSENSTSNDVEDVNPHEHIDSVMSLRRFDEGEASFCGAGHDTFSGAITYSGNLSLQSDGSARSFAFPVLQGEWSSSPVRMTKAEGRHFRKHKGWRSGLFCCRF